MTLIPSTAATAVYHDALSTARSFRTLCFAVVLLCLLAQIGMFFAAKYWSDFPGRASAGGTVTLPSGLDADGDSTPAVSAETAEVGADAVESALYTVLYATLFLGLVFSLLLSLTLAFTTLVMLCGRTVGVDRVTRAFLWSLVLLLLMIPWQAVLAHPSSGGAFRIPGALYTWPELMRNVPEFAGAGVGGEVLGWLRFAAVPLIALILLIVVFATSGGGIKRALGLDLPDADDDLDTRPAS